MLLLFVCTTILLSCSTNDVVDELLGGEGSLTAKVSGSNFESLKSTVSAIDTNGILAIQGSNATGEYIRINLMNYKGVGTYKTGDAISNVNSIAYGTLTPLASWMSTFDIGNGTIEITEDTDSNIKGTFSFLGYNGKTDSKEVTEGKFNALKN